MAEKKKGRAKGSKIETYTYRTSWKADLDGMAALRSAQAVLKGEGTKITQQGLVDLCVQAYLSNLAPQKMVEAARKVLKAQAAADAAAAHAKKVEQAKKDLKAAQEALAALKG